MNAKSFLSLLLSTVLTGTVAAQTANNTPATWSWALSDGIVTAQPAVQPADASSFIEGATITVGSGLSADGADTSETDQITQTKFKVGSKSSSATDANAVSFLLKLKQGVAFSPTKVSLKAFRWVTDKGGMDVKWLCDGKAQQLLTNERPNRATGKGASTVSAYSFDLGGAAASEDVCGLVVNIYGLDAGKWISLGDVVIEGTLYGTVGQKLTYTLTVVAQPAEGGTISVEPAGTQFESGQTVTLTETPAEGYIFQGWYDAGGNAVGNAPTYTHTMRGNAVLTARYATLQQLQVNDYKVVDNIGDFRAALSAANADKSGRRHFIFLKNGTYDYGTYHNPESGATPYGRDTIEADNVTIVGQSAEGVTIQIQPEQASVSRTAPIVIKGTGTYLQDLTLQNNFSYSGDDGQAAALMDKGHHTIGKNLRLVSRQDTYYSNTDTGQLYFETSHFEGTVDFVCGRGDVYFNRCNLVCSNRYPKSGDNKGDTHIGAPYTVVEPFDQPGGHGYVFNDCHIDCLSQTWDFGRGWRGWPKMAFLNSRLSSSAVMRLGTDQTKGKAVDLTLRVGTKGIQSSSDSHAMRFYEYNTMDEAGQVVSPSSNKLTFTASDSETYETILTADEARRYDLRSIYPDWAPDALCRQVLVTEVARQADQLSWTTAEPAKAFLIERDGAFVAIVDGTQQHLTVGEGQYTVRAANMMGGFGPATKEGETADGIARLTTARPTQVYSLAGQRLPGLKRGLNIVAEQRADGTSVVRKQIVR